MKLKPYQVALVLSCTLFLRSGCAGPSEEQVFSAMLSGHLTGFFASIGLLYLLFSLWKKLRPELVFPWNAVGVLTSIVIAYALCIPIVVHSYLPFSAGYQLSVLAVGVWLCGTTFLVVSLLMFRLFLTVQPRFTFTGALVVPSLLFFGASTIEFALEKYTDFSQPSSVLLLLNAAVGVGGIFAALILLILIIEPVILLREKEKEKRRALLDVQPD